MPPAVDPPGTVSDVEVSTIVALGTDPMAARDLLTTLRKAAAGRHEIVAVLAEDASAPLREVAEELAEHTVTVGPYEGVARRWNRGVAAAAGRFVAFCAAEHVPAGWDLALAATADRHPSALVVAADAPDDGTEEGHGGHGSARLAGHVSLLAPFSTAPPAALYLVPTDAARALGPWDEGYLDSGGLALDLCFTAWTNGRDVVVDHDVEVVPAGGGTAPVEAIVGGPAIPAPHRPAVGLQRRFSDKWRGDGEITRLAGCPPEQFAWNRAVAASVTGWIDRDASARDDEATRMRRQLRAMGAVNRQLQAQADKPATRLERTARGVVGPTGRKLANRLSPATVRRLRALLHRLPEPVELQVRRITRRLGIRRGPARA